MKLRAALLGAVAVLGLAPAAFAERGTDGEVKLTFPQAVSIMNPYLSGGTKDIYAASMVVVDTSRMPKLAIRTSGSTA